MKDIIKKNVHLSGPTQVRSLLSASLFNYTESSCVFSSITNEMQRYKIYLFL